MQSETDKSGNKRRHLALTVCTYSNGDFVHVLSSNASQALLELHFADSID